MSRTPLQHEHYQREGRGELEPPRKALFDPHEESRKAQDREDRRPLSGIAQRARDEFEAFIHEHPDADAWFIFSHAALWGAQQVEAP